MLEAMILFTWLAVYAQVEAPKDFIDQIDPLLALVACTKDHPIPAAIEPEAYDEYCQQIAWNADRHQRLFDYQGADFFEGLLPADLPRVAVYPFSAADLTSALDTFPAAEEIITISEDRAGDPRKIARTLESKQLRTILKPLLASANAALLWGDSKTASLGWAQRTGFPPALLLFTIALAAHGDRPVSLRFFQLEDDGAIRYLTPANLDEIERRAAPRSPSRPPRIEQAFANSEIVFASPDGAMRVHRHIAAGLTDWELKKAPGLEAFLESKGAIAAMTKSSSYRLWQPTFSSLRSYLLAHMEVMVSDSTGIPLEFARRSGFEQLGYGHFAHTAIEQNERYNRDLREVFSSTVARALPFRYGYLDSNRHFHLVITRKLESDSAEPPAISKPRSAERVDFEEDLEAGKHWRLWTRRDAVHVYMPAGYRPETAGWTIFVHGYYVDADRAWSQFELGDQFAASDRNALFVVPEASIGDEEGIFWPDLRELLETVIALTKVKPPLGPAIVMAHSGGFRTVASWLESNVREIVLLDAAYGRLRDFKSWVEGDGRRQMVLTSSSTAERAREFASKCRSHIEQDQIPDDPAEIQAAAKAAQVVYLESQYEHTEMVKNKKVIPLLLRLSPLEPR
jgi:hypothetical protein